MKRRRRRPLFADRSQVKLVPEYYRFRGWDEDGRPEEKLRNLGIEAK